MPPIEIHQWFINLNSQVSDSGYTRENIIWVEKGKTLVLMNLCTDSFIMGEL
jgi:hypothetical protein